MSRPGPPLRPVMRLLFEDIAAAIAIAARTFAISKAMWFGLAALL